MSFIQGADGLENIVLRNGACLSIIERINLFRVSNWSSVSLNEYTAANGKTSKWRTLFLQMLEDIWSIDFLPLQIGLCDRTVDTCVAFLRTYHKWLNWIIDQCWYHLSESWYCPKCFWPKIKLHQFFQSMYFVRIFVTRLVDNSNQIERFFVIFLLRPIDVLECRLDWLRQF